VNKDAAYAQYQIAMCNYKELTTIDRDPSSAYAVVTEMQNLLQKYPNSGYEGQAGRYIAECRNWIADYELYVGRFYYKKGAYTSAVARFEKLLQDYPGSPAEKDALYYLGLSYRKLGQEDQARSRLEALVQKYPAMKTVARSHINELQTP
jgi:outer membrane protein assembly factor BamD